MGLRGKQGLFVAEYLKDLNGKQAAIRAGYSPRSAESTASTILRNPKVQAAIAEAQQRRSERIELKADDIVRELLRFAKTDIRKAFDKDGRLLPIHEMPEDVAHAISGIEVLEEWGPDGEGGRVPIGEVKKVKFWDKVKGLELLGRHLKMFVDRFEVKTDDTFAELLKKARERAQRK